MSSPIIEQVRTIPLIVEKDYAYDRDNLIPMEDDEIDEISGFPFDDDIDRRERAGNFRSQLDDIAQRHPEFAEHLHSFRNRGSEPASAPSAHHQPFYQRAAYADRPFGSRFDRYFPFDDRFDVEPEEYRQFYQSRPDYYPEYQQEQQTNPPPAPEQQKQQQPSEEQQKKPAEPEQVQKEQNNSGRNLQQSNTVDLGKEQEPVNDRQQRSMSAPPPENRPRFRSHINIPINADNNQTQQQSQPQPQQQAQPQPQNRPAERVIPIHVEGRDEPVIPRNVHQTFTSAPPPPQYQHHHPQPQQRQQQQPQAERIFGQRPEMFTQFVSPGFGRQNDDIFRQQQQQYQREQEQKYRQQQEEAARQQQQQQHQQQHPPQQQQQPNQQQQQNQNETQKPPEQPKPAPPSSPIDQIKAIQKDVSDLMTQVEQFAGALKDKQYLYLEEMLTRQILKLDSIDAQGQENIRSARKDSIRCIEATLSLLESKAKANAAGNNAGQPQQQEEKMDVEQPTANEGQKEEKMETDPSAEKATAESMEAAAVVPEEEKNVENRAVLVTEPPATTTEGQGEKKEDSAPDAAKAAEAENKETENSDKKEKKKTKKKAADKK